MAEPRKPAAKPRATGARTNAKRSAPAKRRTTAAKKTKNEDTTRSTAIKTVSVGAALGAIAAAIFGAVRLVRRAPSGAEHVPNDLMGDTHPDGSERAAEAFRPDPTAPVPASERDAFRPALAGSEAPTLVKGQASENERVNAMPS